MVREAAASKGPMTYAWADGKSLKIKNSGFSKLIDIHEEIKASNFL